MTLNRDWYATEKETDPNFEGSIWQKLGYEDKLCPDCGAHLHHGICLNACHLSQRGRILDALKQIHGTDAGTAAAAGTRKEN